MIIVDRALQARAAAANPIRVGLVGVGYMGRAIIHQIICSVPGMTLAAIANRHVEAAMEACANAGAAGALVSSQATLEDSLGQDVCAVTSDAELLCRARGIDVLIEATGTIEFAARVVLEAIAYRKPVILMNAELDATIGPILKARAERAGVVITGCDGDQPGAQLNLHRFVTGLGFEPLVMGNVKGFLDPYRTPATQAAFAQRWGQSASMVTAFADGSKVAFEQAVVANATGATVARRGMYGHHFAGHVDDATGLFDLDRLEAQGSIVDYLLGAKPRPGIFIYATHPDAFHRHYLEYYKLGPGPFYSFYTPYHLCHFEVPISVARVALFDDVVIQPAKRPVVEVIAVAKRDLDAGARLDGIGEFTAYGQCERVDIARRDHLLPIGLAEGARLTAAVARDDAIRLDQVELPANRLCDRLWAEQSRVFRPDEANTPLA